MYYILFFAMQQLGLIADNWWYLSLFRFLFSALPCPLSKHKGCPCMETVINLFPIAIPMTSYSSVKLEKTLSSHDGSADILSPPGAVYTNSNGFDGEEVSCGKCGFCSALVSGDIFLQWNCLWLFHRGKEWALRAAQASSVFLSLCLLTLRLNCVFRPVVILVCRG